MSAQSLPGTPQRPIQSRAISAETHARHTRPSVSIQDPQSRNHKLRRSRDSFACARVHDYPRAKCASPMSRLRHQQDSSALYLRNDPTDPKTQNRDGDETFSPRPPHPVGCPGRRHPRLLAGRRRLAQQSRHEPAGHPADDRRQPEQHSCPICTPPAPRSRQPLEVLLLARASGLLRLGTVSIDGTKIDANASKIRSVPDDRAKGRTQPHRPYDFLPPPEKPARRITEPWRIAMKAKLETEDGKRGLQTAKADRGTGVRHHQKRHGVPPASTAAVSKTSPPSGS